MIITMDTNIECFNELLDAMQSAMAGFSNKALLRLELHSGSSGQMRRASSGHCRSAGLWVKKF